MSDIMDFDNIKKQINNLTPGTQAECLIIADNLFIISKFIVIDKYSIFNPEDNFTAELNQKILNFINNPKIQSINCDLITNLSPDNNTATYIIRVYLEKFSESKIFQFVTPEIADHKNFDFDIQKILKIITKNPGISQRDLIRKTQTLNLKYRQTLTEYLLTNNFVECKISGEHKKQKKVYYAIKQ